jgi:PTS system cellobiose-specific IIB component
VIEAVDEKIASDKDGMMASYNVLLVCAAGMSSSLLENKTMEAARAEGHDLVIHAVSVGEIALFNYADTQVELILIAPQVRYKKKSVTEMAAPHGIVVQDIEPITFGMVDGDKLFRQIKLAIPKEVI